MRNACGKRKCWEKNVCTVKRTKKEKTIVGMSGKREEDSIIKRRPK